MIQILLSPWTGPCGGVPPFDKAKVDDFKPALLAGIDANRAEIASIASNPAPPDFANTIAALEDSGRALHRVGVVYGVFASTLNDKAMQAVEMEMAPVLAAFADEVIQNAALFARVKAVYEARETSGLTPEQQRLVLVVYRNFARHGAALDNAGKTRLAVINQRLATLYTEFGQNVLADEEEQFLVLDSEADLEGLSPQQRDAARAAADGKTLKGKWVIHNTRSDMEPFLTYAARRDLREKAHRLWTSRGDGAHDNKPLIREILSLRAEKVKLLGFPTFAHWVTDDQMAKTPDAAMALMEKVWKPAVARVREEVAEMQKIVDAEKGGFKIAPWDFRYYAEKVRQAEYAIDQNAIKAYLQADKIVDAAFWAAGELYGFEFVEVTGVPVATADVRVFELWKNGEPAGLFYLDPYARAGKLSGAWMSEYRTQERFKGDVTPIVSNNANFVGGSGDVLLSWDDAVTIFHEFGHALHALNSNVTYPSLSGTNVVRDFVEFPSQLNERWLSTPELLSKFAHHHETGEPMPEALIAKIRNAQKFNQGFATVEFLASAIVDMKAHLVGDASIDAAQFEKDTLREIDMPEEIVMRHRMPHFTHIFSGEGYASGYYDYIWADTLVADAAEAFREAPGGFYDEALARKLHDDILSVGNTVDAAEAFHRFRGRDVRVEALMRDRGFPVDG
ncbi:MAG TPA: M3 family metallopeptidase [Rhizomicrobium sp.]|nr:M3 family metallopeptidase [Rhizomicrobium sp.]